MDDMKERLMRSVRANLNHLLDNVRDFEERGGFRSIFDPDADEGRRFDEGFEEIGGNSRASHPPPTSAEDKTIRDYYANLEIPYGSDLDTVTKAYRRLMRKYHPDNFADDPEKEKMATRLSQDLSVAYRKVKSYLETGRH